LARRFIEHKAQVIVNFFHPVEVSKQTAHELRAFGAQVIRALVAQMHHVDRMFDEIEGKYGRLDILVNSAASAALCGIDEITVKPFNQVVAVNLKGAYW
jgi:NAD(P)-dependent dehydrogenase (short-subunit alcohol dehydrogenase family)